MNTVIKNVWSFLISMKLMVVLVLLFAIASGVATFIENDHGINTSWALVYSSRWFEAIQVLLGISIIGNIFRYKMYQKKKIPVFIFHVAFLFVLVGSGITRYYGYEGVMHIREGAMQNEMISSDAFLQVTATKGDEEHKLEEIVYISELGGRKFDYSMDIDGKELEVSYKDFIGKAVKTAVADEKGEPLVSFVISTPQGPDSYFLKRGQYVDAGPLLVYFDRAPISRTPYIRFMHKNNTITFISNVPIQWMRMADRKQKVFQANTEHPLEGGSLYTVNGVQLVVKSVLNKGRVSVVDEAEYLAEGHMKMNTEPLSALIVDVEYDGEQREIALMGKGKRYKGFTEMVTIGDVELSLEWGSKMLRLPFSLWLRDFILVKYPGSMSPSSYESHVTVIDEANGVREPYHIYMNHILDYGGFLFFQSSYDKDEQGTILSVNHDPGKWPTYLGYALLAIGFILTLLSPHSRFGKLARTKYELNATAAVFVALFVALSSSQPLLAKYTEALI